MKFKLLISALVLISASLTAAEFPIVDVPISGLERETYENLLRIIDETNRKNGKDEFYLNQASNRLDKEMVSKVDIIPFYNLGRTEQLTSSTGYYNKNTYQNLDDVIRNGKKSYSKKKLDMFSKVRMGSPQRYYFGNGNVMNNLYYLNAEDFSKKENEIVSNKKDRYIIKGEYQKLYKGGQKTDAVNPLQISMDEYHEKIEGKSRTEHLKFIKSKLNEEGIDSFIENNELYTKDSDGEKWKVLWKLQGIRYRTSSQELKDKVWNEVFTYKSNKGLHKQFGDIIYAKDGSVYVQDNMNYDSHLRLNVANIFNWNDQTKHYGTHIEKIRAHIKEYATDKKSIDAGTLTQADFDKKWGDEVLDYYEDRYKLDNQKMTQEDFDKTWKAKSNPVELDKDLKDLKASIIAYNNTNQYVVGAWNMRDYKTVEKIDESFITEIANLDKKIKKYPEYSKTYIRQKKELKVFYDFYRAMTKNQIEFAEKHKAILLDRQAFVGIASKSIDLRGQGRVNGTIDLGQGNNTIMVSEPTTGEYGTNLIFGPYAVLKNVNTVQVGAAYGKKPGKPSISGDYSMILDIDENVRNSKGEIIQNLLRDSDPNIIFKPDNPYLPIEQFKIGIILSRLNEDAILNMGRKLSSQEDIVRKNYKTGETITETKIYNMNFVSDSIAHNLELIDREKGILKVTINNKIEGLNSKENAVYRSIKNAKQIGSLSPTLSTANKTTIFGGNRKEESLSELNILISQVTDKNIYSQMGKLSRNETINFTQIPFEINRNVGGKDYVNGGAISTRIVEKNLKGNILTGYGLYQTTKNKMNLGLIIGGSTSSYEEMKNERLDEVIAASKLKGNSAYIGGYTKKLYMDDKLLFVNGIGLQHGEYETTRNMKNRYQEFNLKSKTDVNNMNLYSGMTYNVNLKDNLALEFKGLFSYNFISQKEVNEDSNVFAITVDKKNYNFIDSEFGISLKKRLYSGKNISELSGGLYYSYGILGYGKDELNARINNSTSDFTIENEDTQKDSVKLVLNYEVKTEAGFTYKIGGEYQKNKDKNNVNIKVNVGYTL